MCQKGKIRLKLKSNHKNTLDKAYLELESISGIVSGEILSICMIFVQYCGI